MIGLLALCSAGSLVRQADSERHLDQARSWVLSNEKKDQELGVETLIFLIEFDGFQNLPVVFSLLEKLLRTGPTTMQPELLELTTKLLDRSPIETSYTIRLILESETPGVMTPRIARKLLTEFTEPSRAAIQKLLRLQSGRA